MSGVDCDPMGSLLWSRVLAGLVDLWGERNPHRIHFAGRICDAVEGSHTETVCEELQPVGRTRVEKVHAGLSLLR